MIMGIDEKLYDFLYNFLKESRLMENANSRKEALEEVKFLSDKIVIHVAKIICFPENQTTNHWKGEVAGWLGTLFRRAKTTKGRLKKKDLMDMMWHRTIDEFDDFESLLDGIDDQYKFDLVDTPEHLYDRMYEVIEQICDNLSSGISNKEFIRSL